MRRNTLFWIKNKASIYTDFDEFQNNFMGKCLFFENWDIWILLNKCLKKFPIIERNIFSERLGRHLLSTESCPAISFLYTIDTYFAGRFAIFGENENFASKISDQ